MESTNKEIINGIISGTITLVILAVFLILIIVLFIKRKNKLILENEQQKQFFENSLLKTRLEIQDQTLEKASLDIHDSVGQGLVSAKLYINAIKSSDKTIIDKVNKASEQITKALQEIRDLSKSMNGYSIAKDGLVDAIKNLVARINNGGENFDLTVEGSDLELTADKQLIVFRMVQECINNIIKHSNASKKNIYIKQNFANLEIVLEDNGIGFNPSTIQSGQGLNNLRSRANSINAQLTINSLEGVGTKISIKLGD